jgi:hypothetical protein
VADPERGRDEQQAEIAVMDAETKGKGPNWAGIAGHLQVEAEAQCRGKRFNRHGAEQSEKQDATEAQPPHERKKVAEHQTVLILLEALPLGVAARLHADVAAIGPERLVGLDAGELDHAGLELGVVLEVLAPDLH